MKLLLGHEPEPSTSETHYPDTSIQPTPGDTRCLPITAYNQLHVRPASVQSALQSAQVIGLQSDQVIGHRSTA